MSRIHEFFEDGKKRFSSGNLAFLFTVAVLGFSTLYMVIVKAYMEAVSMAGILASAGAATKIAAKWNDTSVEKAALNPDPVPPQPLATLGPTTIINTGAEKKDDAIPLK